MLVWYGCVWITQTSVLPGKKEGRSPVCVVRVCACVWYVCVRACVRVCV